MFCINITMFKINADEVGPLSYVTGFVLQALFRKSKNLPRCNSPRSQELQFLLLSLKLAETEDYIDSLSRGGSMISSECGKLALENFVKLYVRVRSFPHARDKVNKYKLKEKSSKKKALRKELKNKNV